MSDAGDFDIVNVTRKVKFISKSHFLIEGNQLIRNYFFFHKHRILFFRTRIIFGYKNRLGFGLSLNIKIMHLFQIYFRIQVYAQRLLVGSFYFKKFKTIHFCSGNAF